MPTQPKCLVVTCAAIVAALGDICEKIDAAHIDAVNAERDEQLAPRIRKLNETHAKSEHDDLDLDEIIAIVKELHPIAEGTIGTSKVMVLISEIERLRQRPQLMADLLEIVRRLANTDRVSNGHGFEDTLKKLKAKIHDIDIWESR